MHDLESLAPGKMVNDVMATALLKYECMETKLLSYIAQHCINNLLYIFLFYSEQLCMFPIVDCLFYSILCGEQEGSIVSNRYCETFEVCIMHPKYATSNFTFLKIYLCQENKDGSC